MSRNKATTGPKAVRFDGLTFAPRFAYGEQAAVAEVTGSGDGTPLGTGFARLTMAEIPWTVQYDEVVLVLEGSVTIRTAQGDFEAGPRDSVWLPKGTDLTYLSESALVFFAIHPSDWQEQLP